MNRETGKAPYPPGTEERIPKVRARLLRAPNGYIRSKRFNPSDRAALLMMRDRGEVRQVPTGLGLAYQLVEQEANA